MKLQGVKVVESGCVSLEEQFSAILLVKSCGFYVEVFYDVRTWWGKDWYPFWRKIVKEKWENGSIGVVVVNEPNFAKGAWFDSK